LRDLFIGSEGTLGVITAATLKLQPRALANVTAFAACASPVECVALLDLARARLGSGLTGFEVMGQFALDLVRRHFAQLVQPLPPGPWSVLIEYAASETQEVAKTRVDAMLEAALGQGLITDAAVATSVAQSRNLWHLREAIPLAQSLEGLNIKHDISLPVSVIPDFISQTDAALARRWPGVRMVDFGHFGDGNLHYNVQAPAGTDPAAFLADCEVAVNAVVYDAVCQRGGSISAEHGIGQLKREELRERASPVKLALMKAIKNALDPHNRLNPGRLI
jgi:FAD/FMN-containing dehydrogenase